MKKRSSWFGVFLSYFLISLLLLFLSFGARLSFLYAFSEIIFHPLRVQSYRALTTFRSGESRLAKENAALKSQLKTFSELQKEDAALRDQFQTSSIPASSLLPARVLSEESFIPGVTLPESLVIDKGTGDGLKSGMAVIEKDVLVGTVGAVSAHASVVTLVTNAATSLTAETSKTGAVGIVRGHGRGSMTLENVVLSDRLEKNDLVVTKGDVNGAGAGVMPGLTIGKVTTIHKKASSLFQNAEIQSPVDVTKLTIVFVKK